MSTELDQAREIAERVARRVSSISGPSTQQTSSRKPEVSAELAAVRNGLSELQRKLAQLEDKISSGAAGPGDTQGPRSPAPQAFDSRSQPKPVLITHSPWLAGVNAPYSHPSQEKFGVEEATVSELVDFFEKEKMCSVEPGGKPCDHCAMCSSRGF
ncbi:MAG TPA: hypothetical protein VJV03_01330 [Pyrinomonadaceae bacterium]|nr:hypothetical protein [Pyrinomonadaceae bacterium]